ncbi:MAG: alpha/beta hydrolase [Bryobacteraceae bacterium]
MGVLRFAGLATLAYGAIYFIVSRLIYQPTRYPGGWWHTQTDLGAQDVWLRSRDQVRLHAWWIETPGSRLATLYLHGNGGNLANRPGHLREMIAAGSSVLIPDYRGYGKSDGRPTERGLYLDADAAYDHLIGMGYSPDKIVVQGESLGAAVAVDLASRRPCAGVILECPFTSFSAEAGRFVPWIGRLFASGFQTRRKIGRVHVPVLVIHGDEDRTVPYDMGRAVYEAANEPKWFWTVEGAAHQDIVAVAGDRYHARLLEFHEYILHTEDAGRADILT